nr:hypothetical protein [Halarchaeum acidiphilum]
MTHAYTTGIELTETLRDGACLCAAVSGVTLYTEHLMDGDPDWHPAPDLFEGMVQLFIYREVTGDSYRTLETYQELAEPFELDHVPDESVLSRTWHNRFDDGVREYVTVAAHFVVKEIHDYGITVPAIRPEGEVTHSKPESSEDDGKDETRAVEFSNEQIHRTTRLARDHGFDGVDSGRAQNASYEDIQFFELQTFMGMVRCGTAQGATRFQYRRGEEYGPHGDTHLRAVKQFDPEELVNGFNETTDRLLSVIASEASFRRPVTAAIDITTIPYYGDVEGMPMVSGTKGRDGRAFKFATLSIIGQNIPLVLAVEPVRESSEWDENPSNQIDSSYCAATRSTSERAGSDRDSAV